MGKVIGCGNHRYGLYLLKEFRMQGRMGNRQFAQMVVSSTKYLALAQTAWSPYIKMFEELAPASYKKGDKELLTCEARVLAKHSRTINLVSGNKSSKLFDFIHYDISGPTHNPSTNGCRWFVTFVDCYNKATYLTLLRAKSDVFAPPKTFNKMIELSLKLA